MVASGIDFERLRRNMVDSQLRTTDVNDLRVLEAVLKVGREHFVPADRKALAYADQDVDLTTIAGSERRQLMSPQSTARLIQLAAIQAGDVVLDAGAATGYASAVMSSLATSVIALEESEALNAFASEALSRAGCDNVVTVMASNAAGYPKEAPFDVIFIGGAVDEVPQALFAQLREGGRLVAVHGEGNAGVAKLWVKTGGHVSGRAAFNAAVKRLPGFQKEPGFVF
jgi:protein-L-isoaspartate(D-aspartate) O-methyltransferase